MARSGIIGIRRVSYAIAIFYNLLGERLPARHLVPKGKELR